MSARDPGAHPDTPPARGPGGAPVADSRTLLQDAAVRLGGAGVPSPAADALVLLEHVTGRPRWQLRLGTPVQAREQAAMAGLVAARATRVPTQHLTGVAYFRHLELAVGPGVFIPRPETELLVDAVLEYLGHERDAGRSGSGPLRVVDLCTGSGALALALATEIPGCHVVGVESSPEALCWAAANALAHQERVAAVSGRVQVCLGDARTAADTVVRHWRGVVDVVVSNPPYIPDGAVPRDPEVRDHDPGVALFGGVDGLDVVRPLVATAEHLLRPGGLLVIEHADCQGDQAGPAGVPAVLEARAGAWRDVADHPDLAGRPRYTTARRAGAAPGPSGVGA